MVDVVDAATRSRMMAGIRSKDTKPEISIRKELHRRGLRYRLHVKDLPGKPDIVLPRFNAVILVHGCFWHVHDCSLYRPPKSRQEYWSQKFARNKINDAWAIEQLVEQGWRVCIVTECSIRWPNPDLSSLVDRLCSWLVGANRFHQEYGKGSALDVLLPYQQLA
jgi:DNA mismatch endonuclease (patch repair protein)